MIQTIYDISWHLVSDVPPFLHVLILNTFFFIKPKLYLFSFVNVLIPECWILKPTVLMPIPVVTSMTVTPYEVYWYQQTENEMGHLNDLGENKNKLLSFQFCLRSVNDSTLILWGWTTLPPAASVITTHVDLITGETHSDGLLGLFLGVLWLCSVPNTHVSVPLSRPRFLQVSLRQIYNRFKTLKIEM